MRFFKWILGVLALSLLIVVIGLSLLQLPWTKQKITELLFEAAKKEGVSFTIKSIEGEPPFKWTLQNVHIKLNESDTLDIDTLRIRIAILPLLKRELSISYFNIEEAVYRFQPSSLEKPIIPVLPFAVTFKSAKIDRLVIEDVKANTKGIFTVQGKGSVKRKGKSFFAEGKATNAELAMEFSTYGNRRSDIITSSLSVDAYSKTAFSPYLIFPVEASFSLQAKLQGPWKTWESILLSKPSTILEPLKGQIKTTIKKLDLEELRGLDQSGFIEASFSLFSDRSLDFSSLSLKSDLLCFKGQGKIDSEWYPKNISFSFLLPYVSRLVPHMGGIVTGDGNYNGSVATFSIASDQLEIGATTFNQLKASFDVMRTQGIWNGSLKFSATHPTIPIEGNGIFSFEPHRFINLKDFSLKGPDTQVSGDLVLSLPELKTSGALIVRIQDLSHFEPLLTNSKLGGRLAGKVHFENSQANFYGVVQKLQCYEILSNELTIDGFVTDILSSPKGKFSFDGKTTYFSHLFFDTLNFSTWWEQENWPFTISGKGQWKDPLEFQAAGRFHIEQNGFDFHLDDFSGIMLQKSLHLQKPFSINMNDKSLVVTECRFQFDQGYLRAALDLSSTLSKIYIKTEHFPIDLFALGTSRLSLQGNSSLEASLEGSENNLQGRINLLLEEGKVLQPGKKEPIQTKGSFQANLDKGIVQIHGEVVASNEQYFELTGTIPIAYKLYPLKIGVDKNKMLSGELTIDGHLEELFDFINIGSNHITGLLSGKLLLSRTFLSPSLIGTIEVQNGSYENYFTGMMFHDIQLKAQSEGNVVRFTSIEAKDTEGGSVTGTGRLTLQEKLPFSFEANTHNLKILELNWLSGAISGPVNISGNTDSTLAKGNVVVSRADFHIPDQLPIDIPNLPVTYMNQPPYLNEVMIKPEKSYPFYYDAELSSDGNIFLSGRGLESELEGKVHLSGKNHSCDVGGTLRLQKGKFSFSGKDFTLTNGEITFSPTAYLNITGTLSLPNLTVTAMLRGPLTSPQLTFQSNPSMPTSSILAQILFNKDISELNAAQALQLADTIVTLSGGAGPGVLETIRKSLGVDRLNIVSSGDSDQVSVQIGKYLTQGVMVTLSQSAESSQIIVEIQLKGGFVLQAETQEDEQGKFSFKWNKNY